MGDLNIKIDGDASGFWGALEKSRKKASAWGKGIGDILKGGLSMSGLVGGGLGVGAVGMFLKSSTSAALGFSKGLSEVGSIAKWTRGEMANLKKDLLEISTSKGFDTKDLTKAAYQSISSGVNQKEMRPFLETAGNAAVAGVTDLTTSVNGISTVVNAFNMDFSQADKVADTFFATVSAGKTTFSEISQNIGQVASLAATAGYSFEEVAGAMVVLTNTNGSTAQSTTQLKAAIQALVNPTAELRAKLDAIAKAEGVSDVSALSLQKTLELVAKSCNYSKSEVAALFPSVEALQGVFSLTGDNANKASEALDKTANSAGMAAAAYAQMSDDPAQKIAKLNAALNEQKILIGDALLPVITKYAEGLASALTMADKMGAAKATGRYADSTGNALGFVADYVGSIPQMFTGESGSDMVNDWTAKSLGHPLKMLDIQQTPEEQEKDRKYYTEKAKRVAGKDVKTTVEAKAALAEFAGSEADKNTDNKATSTPKTRKAQDQKDDIDKRKAAADKQAAIANEVKQARENNTVNEIVEKRNKKAEFSGEKQVKIGFTQSEKDDKYKAARLQYESKKAKAKQTFDDEIVSADADFESGKITVKERDELQQKAYKTYADSEGEAKAVGVKDIKEVDAAKTITNSDKLKQVMEASGVSDKIVAKLSLEYDKASSDKEKAKALADVNQAMTAAEAKQKKDTENKKTAKDDFSKRLQSLKQETAYQDLLNQGKEREAAIEKEIDDAKAAAKAKGQNLTEGQEKQLRKAAGNNYEAANPWQGIEGRNINISNNAMSRVGGGDGTKASGWASSQNKIASTSEKAAAAAEKTVKLLERIESKSGKSGGMIWP